MLGVITILRFTLRLISWWFKESIKETWIPILLILHSGLCSFKYLVFECISISFLETWNLLNNKIVLLLQLIQNKVSRQVGFFTVHYQHFRNIVVVFVVLVFFVYILFPLLFGFNTLFPLGLNSLELMTLYKMLNLFLT